MTTLAHPAPQPSHSPPDDPATDQLPSRRLLVGLATIYFLLFAVLFATGGESPSPETSGAKIIADYDVSDVLIQVATYALIVTAALLIFYGAALRTVLQSARRHWTGDVAFIGFVVMALTLAGFAVSALAVHHAVETGDAQVAQAINVLDNANFPPAMLALICAMVGTGLASWRVGVLPRWLAGASVVIGCMAPLGPGGIVPFMLFPVWLIVVAALVRRPEQVSPA
jgi:hypothetical protein